MSGPQAGPAHPRIRRRLSPLSAESFSAAAWPVTAGPGGLEAVRPFPLNQSDAPRARLIQEFRTSD